MRYRTRLAIRRASDRGRLAWQHAGGSVRPCTVGCACNRRAGASNRAGCGVRRRPSSADLKRARVKRA